MMLYRWIVLIFLTIHTLSAHAVQWHDQFSSARTASESSGKPILLFFTGSDWCGWANRLEEEALNTTAFAEKVGADLIYLRVDLPMYAEQSPEIARQNKALAEQFGVRSYPTIILLDSKGRTMGIAGYLAGGGAEYGMHIKSLVDDYTDYRKKVDLVGKEPMRGKEIKRLYQQAHALQIESDYKNLLQAGISSDLAHFFLAERYRLRVGEGKGGDPETLALRKELLEGTEERLVHYQIALIDFENMCSKNDPDCAVLPLIAYIDAFGDEDKENLWRLHMVIAQTYLGASRFEKALTFAEKSKRAAPEKMYDEIALLVNDIQLKMQ